MYYQVSSASTYKPKISRHEYIFWTLGQAVRIVSLYPFNKGDLVEIVEIAEDTIRVTPARVDHSLISKNETRLLTILCNAVPVASDSEYEIVSDTAELLVTKECEYKGNKKYIVAVGLRLDCSNRIVATDRVTGTQFELQVDTEEID